MSILCRWCGDPVESSVDAGGNIEIEGCMCQFEMLEVLCSNCGSKLFVNTNSEGTLMEVKPCIYCKTKGGII